MMGGPRRSGVCVAIVVVVVVMVVVAQVAAQAGDDSLGSPSFIPRSNSRKFSSGHKIISSPALLREIARMKSKPGLSHRTPGGSDYLDVIGGVREDSDGPKWYVGGHSYKLDEGSEREWVGPGSGYTGKAGVPLRGEATREGPRHFLGVSDGVEEEQMSEASGDERPSSSIPVTNPDEDETSVPGPQLPAVPGDESASWSKEADLWRYREGEWEEVRLPDPSYSSLPTPDDPPAVALVVATIGKVKVERRLEGLKNVTIHCRFYLSDSHHPDTLPELEVYFVNDDGSRERLAVETIPGAWQEQNIQVPEADNSSIIIEGWLKAEGDIIALSNLYTTGVTPGRDEALDADLDEMTLAANTTENVTSTLEAQGTGTEMTDQDNTTRTSNADNIQVDASQNPGEGNTEEGTDAVMPTDESEVGASTGVPESESRATAQVNGSMDAVTLNSSISSSDDMTPGGNVSSDFKTTVTNIDAENNEAGENSTIATLMDGDSGASENGTEEAFVTTGKEHDSTTASLPGVATDDLQTNASNTLPNGNSSATGGPLITTEAAVNSETPGGILPETPFTDGQNLSTNVFAIDNTNSDTTLGGLESNTTSGNVTGEAAFPGEALMESTPPSAGNSTEAVMAVPVSNTSWQVFQIFLVLCLMGLLALGFLYWKRKRRQDDEIPVFTRGTDYHNPTFTMEDAANFMSRGSRNTYKTIE